MSEANLKNKTMQLLSGGGEMGELMRTKDWANTPLGNIDTWPQSLLLTLGIILNSKFPMFIFWGPESICFYNDAYRPSLGNNGKHPSILGQKGKDCWPEIWATIKPLIDDVLQGKESLYFEDQLLPIYRNGKMEDVYWSYSYSAIKDEFAKIGGVLVTCSETTDKVKDLKKIEAITNKFRDSVLQAPVAMCVFMGPEHIVQTVNIKMLELWGKTAEQTLHKKVFEGVPEAAGQGFEQLLDQVYKTGEHFSANEVPVKLARGKVIETVFVNFIFEPFRETDGSIVGITAVATDVTIQVMAKQALEVSQVRFRNLVEQSPVAMAIFRSKDLVIELSNKSLRNNIWRKRADEVTGKKLLDVFPELVNQSFPGLMLEVFRTGIPYKESEAVALVNSFDGQKKFYLDYEYAPLFETDGSVSGIMVTVNDVTEKVEAREKIKDAADRLYLATEGTKTATWDLDLVNKRIIHSPRLALIFGHEESKELTHVDLRGQVFADDVRNIVEPAFEKAMTTGIYYYEARIVLPDKSTRWIKTRGKVIFDTLNVPVRMLGTIVDMTDQRLAEESFVKLAAIVQSSDDALSVNDWMGQLSVGTIQHNASLVTPLKK